MRLPIHLNCTPLARPASVGFWALLVRFLTLVNIILIITITCLDLTAFITRSTPVPTLSGHLVDNGKFVCSVNLALTFGPRLPWNCIDGIHAYSTQGGRQLVYTRDNFLRPGSSRQFILSNVRQKVQQDAYGENQHTVIKGMWFGCKLSDTFNDVYKNKRRLTIHERRMKGRVFLGGEVVDERGDIVIAKVLEKTVDEESA